MSQNVFYADLDKINGKGVFVTGHGKGLVSKNASLNGSYVANDMVKLVLQEDKLFGYQGYIPKKHNELTEIEILLYFYAQDEPRQPTVPTSIAVDDYLILSKHNIDTGDALSVLSTQMFGQTTPRGQSAFSEYEEILRAAKGVRYVAVPYTADENQRAAFVNKVVETD